MAIWKLALAPVRQRRWRFASALPSSHAKWDLDTAEGYPERGLDLALWVG